SWSASIRRHDTPDGRRGSDWRVEGEKLATAVQGVLQLSETDPSLHGGGQVSWFVGQLPLQALHAEHEIHPSWRLPYAHVTATATRENGGLVFRGKTQHVSHLGFVGGQRHYGRGNAINGILCHSGIGAEVGPPDHRFQRCSEPFKGGHA